MEGFTRGFRVFGVGGRQQSRFEYGGSTMGFRNRAVGGFPPGVWVALVAILLLMLAWVMQAYSLFDWDTAVDLGLQNERFGDDPVEWAWAHESRSVAIADMLWPLPLGVFALVGLLRRRLFGLVAGMMELAIGLYFPLVFALQRWTTFRETAIVALCLWTVPCALGIAGLWVNRRVFED